MLHFAVSEEKNRWLAARMSLCGIREQDLEETFVRSSGKGGQHVNKTSTCVHLRHIPTGVEVKCMVDRSQSVNRFLARRLLVERLESGSSGAQERKAARLRKQKAKRKKRSSSKYDMAGESDSASGSDVVDRSSSPADMDVP